MSHLFCAASILKGMFRTFRATVVQERVPSGSTFAWNNQKMEYRNKLTPVSVAKLDFYSGWKSSQQHRVTKNNPSFRNEIHLSVDWNE